MDLHDAYRTTVQTDKVIAVGGNRNGNSNQWTLRLVLDGQIEPLHLLYNKKELMELDRSRIHMFVQLQSNTGVNEILADAKESLGADNYKTMKESLMQKIEDRKAALRAVMDGEDTVRDDSPLERNIL